MKKRIVSVLMAGALASAMLAGCGNSSAPAASDAAEDTAEDTTEEADAAEDSAEAEDAAPAELDYDGDIKVWVADNAVSFTQEQIAKFQEANPGVANATFTVEAVGEEMLLPMSSQTWKQAEMSIPLHRIRSLVLWQQALWRRLPRERCCGRGRQ